MPTTLRAVEQLANFEARSAARRKSEAEVRKAIERRRKAAQGRRLVGAICTPWQRLQAACDTRGGSGEGASVGAQGSGATTGSRINAPCSAAP